MINLYSPITIKSIFNKYNIKPKKYLGQNFVINKSVIENIVKTADLNAGDTVVEVGPGLGALTIELAKKTKQVIAVEKDLILCKILSDILQTNSIKNVIIAHKDILNFQFPPKHPAKAGATGQAIFHPTGGRPKGDKFQKYKVVANIPYYITQPIIRLFLESETPPQSITLLVQKEVAQRICAVAPKMNLLAVSVQFYAQPEIISYVSKNNFWPQPKVDSAIITISQIRINQPPKENPWFPTGQAKISPMHFFKTVRAGFSSPRKMLIGNLNNKLKIPREIILKIYQNLNINPKARAENLTIKEWEDLSTTIFSHQTGNMV